MEIESTTFGTITMGGKTYEHDVVVRLSGEVVKRKKKLSKKYYGTSHILSKDEAKFVFEKGCEELIVGSGQIGNVRLSPEAEAYFAKKNCKVLIGADPRGHPSVQQIRGKEDRSFSRNLLKNATLPAMAARSMTERTVSQEGCCWHSRQSDAGFCSERGDPQERPAHLRYT